jgi:hypothetical protein
VQRRVDLKFNDPVVRPSNDPAGNSGINSKNSARYAFFKFFTKNSENNTKNSVKIAFF